MAMTKAEVQKFADLLDNLNIEWYIRYANANQMICNKSESSRAYILGDGVYGIETAGNYADVKGRFNVKYIPFANCEFMFSRALTVKELIDVMNAAGIEKDDDLDKFIKVNGSRVVLNPGVGNYAEHKDEDGNIILADNIPARVTSNYFDEEPKSEDGADDGDNP